MVTFLLQVGDEEQGDSRAEGLARGSGESMVAATADSWEGETQSHCHREGSWV